MNILKKLNTFLLGAALSSVVLGSVVHADDTEIFFGQSEDAFNTNPNVLFVLDTSGSMNNFDGGDNSRMDRLKMAMRILLRESSDFNVGLMGFSGSSRGGSIHYPVSDLEGDGTNNCPDGVCPDERVVVKTEGGIDDATQNDDTQVVSLNDPTLIMADVNSGPTSTTTTQSDEIDGIAYAVAISAETEQTTATPNSRSITGSSNWFYNGTPGSEDDRYAYRFENLDIPQGAVITYANLTFTQTNALAQTGNLSALVKLESTATPDPLPDGGNGFESIADRLVTSTQGVQWNNVAPDTTGAATTDTGNLSITPDLSEIMNLVVTLPNWAAGNALSFIIDPVDEYTPSAADVREFKGVNALGSERPTLIYSYTTSIDTNLTTTVVPAIAHLDEITLQASDTVSRNQSNAASRTFFVESAYYPRKLAFRFDNVDIPFDAVIQSATLVLNGTVDANDEAPLTDWVVDASTEDTSIPLTEVIIPESTTTTSTTDPSENQISFNIKAESTGTPLPYATDPISTRTFTTEFESWNNLNITPGGQLNSPNLKDVIAEVINTGVWNQGESLSLLIEAPATYNNVVENSALIDTSTGGTAPSLSITWKPNSTVDTSLLNTQTTALRFSNVHVPPRAQIKTARLIFTAAQASIGPVSLEISAENISTSPPFTDVANNLVGRQRTPQKEIWNVETWDIPNEKYASRDLKAVVQHVVDLPEWCGGNPLTVFLKKISGTDSRHAISADQNLVSAPTLELTYEPGTVPAGAFCSNATFLSSVSQSAGDATEDVDTNAVTVNNASLDSVNSVTGNKQKIGLMFPSLGIPKDAVIVSASLEMTLEKDITQAQDYKFQVEQTLDPLPFNNTDQKLTSSSRLLYSSDVTASAEPGIAPTSVFRSDVSSLISEKVSDANWIAGKPLVIIGEALGNIPQSFYSFDGEESRAPQLVVYYQSERENPGSLFRDKLIAIVDDMVAQSGTPIVGSYYEASKYFSGLPIDYGLKRGYAQSRDRYHRVSHPLSYTGGEIQRSSSCLDTDLSSYQCRTEQIVSKDGATPTYISPIESECQQNHIVILSDGKPTSNTAASKVRNLTGASSCEDSGSKECGVELANWLQNSDISSTVNGQQNLTTHTIGFNLDDSDFLEDIAMAGGGNFYEADSAAQLLNAFKNIFINVSKTDTSFVAPSATVSQANRLKNRDDIYFSLFKPEGTARWAGNLKRYRLAAADDAEADILDVNGDVAVDAATGRFFETARSYWSDVVDGDSVVLGGAAEKREINGVSHLARKVYTYTEQDTDLTNDYYNELLPTNTFLDVEWLKLTATLAANDEYVTNLINWAHGRDEFDIDGDGDIEEGRAEMGDPMHSQPLLVNYTGGRSIVHVATNEGFLHAIDHDTGEENYAFIPKELLPNLRRLYENQPTKNRPYGLDGGMTLWVDDANNDGIVNPDTDKAYLYIGMRRGGNLYYALDITDPDNPKYLWSIAGGANTFDSLDTTADGDFLELGDTWSKPIKSKIYDNNVIRDVLIFGAGYGANQDPIDIPEGSETTLDAEGNIVDNRQTRQEDSVGRGFFIVDARTGEKIWNADIAFYPQLKYSVPSELRVIDINFDGLADQIYFGDMGGQVWRFDYNNDMAQSESVDSRMNGGRIGHFAGDTPESARRFYYPPDIALVSIDGEQQLSVSIGSGWRAHPLDDVVEDRFYSFRMKQVYGVPITEDGEVRYPEVTESTTGMVELNDSEPVRTTNKTEKGWFLAMLPGEKVLSNSVTIDGSLIFTSYIPSGSTGTCSAATGSGGVYFLDLATGSAVLNLDGSEDTGDTTTDEDMLEVTDRRRQLSASGIPPEAMILFPEAGKATAFVGRDKLEEVQINTLKTRTFWQEHIEENL